MSFEVGTRVWYPDAEHGWIGAEIVKLDTVNNSIDILLENGGNLITIDINLNDQNNNGSKGIHTDIITDEQSRPLLLLRNPPILESTDDLTSLSYLNEPAVLHAIKQRFINQNIYTYSGIVLIATNPFHNVDQLYSNEMINKYNNNNNNSNSNNEILGPHIFAIADKAYKEMVRDNGKNQTIIVSGESGAGKTVSAKYIMRYYASIQEETSEIEEKILATNPIMEAFGNAKTTRNDNSSRFGKYIAISFNNKNKIIGASINTYLLERSRLIFQPNSERNYHIFYQLLNGLDNTLKEKLHLTLPNDYFYMNQGGEKNLTIPDVDDSKEFQITINALEMIGISKYTQLQIFEILSGILHIGNIEIKKLRTDSTVSSDDPNLKIACDLLGIDSFNFVKWITKKQINTRSEKIISNLNFNQATVVRDSVAKFIYSALFDWIVENINIQLNSTNSQENIKSFIGVLDIYGFEHFEKNSFEQFCINYANEKLQQEFNQHVFKLEQDEYVKEEIEWSFIEFNDNQQCIDLIENKLGILSLLDEESRLPAGSDESWTQKLYQTFDKPPTNQVFGKPRFGQTKFVVSHYANDVAYDIEGFIEKNKDSVSENHLEILKASTNMTLNSILQSLEEKRKQIEEKKNQKEVENPGPRRITQKKPTLGSLFKESLMELMLTINSTNAHYIRCIKPNAEKEAWKFDNLMVLSQLRACGVLETIKISCAGFPSRWTFEEFIQRYYFLVSSDVWSLYMYNNDSKVLELVENILSTTIKDKNKYQIGRTKIFFKAGMLAYLEKIRSDKLSLHITCIQKKIKGRYYRKKYLETIQSIKCVQSHARSRLIRDRIDFEFQTRAATIVQSLLRGKTMSRKYSILIGSIVNLQSLSRKCLVKNFVSRERHLRSSILIQSKIRGAIERRDFNNSKRAAVSLQSHIRKRNAQLEYIKLKESMKFVNSPESKLTVEFLDFIKGLSERIKDGKERYTFIKRLEDGEFVSTILSEDDEYQKFSKDFEDITMKLKDQRHLIDGLVSNHEQQLDNMKYALRALEEIEFHKENKFNGTHALLESRIELLFNEIKIIKNANRPIKTKKMNKSSNALGLGIHSIAAGKNNNETAIDNDDKLSELLMNTKVLKTEIIDNILNSPNTTKSYDETFEGQDMHYLNPSRIIIFILHCYIEREIYEDMNDFIISILSEFVDKISKLEEDKTLVSNGLCWLTNMFEIFSFVFSISKTNLYIDRLQEEVNSAILNVFNLFMRKMIRYVRYDIDISDILIGSPSNFERTKHSDNKSDKSITHLLIFFYEIIKNCEKYHLEDAIMKSIISNILIFTDSLCFNNLIVKFFGLSWRLGLHLDKNIKSLDEWFIKHGIPIDPSVDLCHIRQLSKFLQLRMSNVEEFKIVCDFCYLLNPVQLQTILKKYKPSKREPQVSLDVLNYIINSMKKIGQSRDSLTVQMEVQTFKSPFINEETGNHTIPLRAVPNLMDPATSFPGCDTPTVDKLIQSL